ncbi:MAG: hypothetical protein HRU38_22205 [Saccharospirillaceae bacterium]|nr:hypothetical protein [Saccharospirillaceae bacterium]
MGYSNAIAAIGPEGLEFQDNIGDVIEGPDSGEIRTWAGVVGSSMEEGEVSPRSNPNDDFNSNDNPKNYMHTSTAWVTKQFGDSYDYVRGNEIDIRVGHSEVHQRGNTYEFMYGGTHEETKFNGAGRKVTYEKGGGGSKLEINWHHLTGDITSYEYKENSWFSYEGSFVTVPTIAISTSLSTLRAKVDFSLGALDINAEIAVGMKIDIKGTAGFGVEMERALGGKFVLSETDYSFEFKAFGMKAAQRAALEAEAKNLVVTNALTELGNKSLVVDNKPLEIVGGALTVDGKGFKFF